MSILKIFIFLEFYNKKLI